MWPVWAPVVRELKLLLVGPGRRAPRGGRRAPVAAAEAAAQPAGRDSQADRQVETT